MSVSIQDTTFVVCDVETTGMSPGNNRITEICLVKVRGGEVVDSYESLVNPQTYIPPFITQLTGITNAMVYGAPTMERIAGEVAMFIEGGVFVAHNASFDWGFVSAELARATVAAPAAPVLCTVRLARRLFPGMKSYRLSAITAALGIPLRSHHRARGDTDATAVLLTTLLQRAREAHGIEDVDTLVALQFRRPMSRRPERVRTIARQAEELPTAPGVYYFRDAKENILYVGKAKNLRARVRSYFQTTLQETSKVRQLLRRTASITHEELPSELHALLREAKLIELHQPQFNSALRRKKRFPFLRLSSGDPFPRIDLAVEIADDGAEYFGPFRTFGTARMALDLIDHLFQLRKCDDHLHPDAAFAPCFYHDIKRCAAPCAVRQSEEEYAQDVARVRKFLAGGGDNIVEQVEARMRESAARLEFEEAAFLRDRISELRGVVTKPLEGNTAVSGQNYLFILPAHGIESDIYFIRSGRLGKVSRAPLDGSVHARLLKGIEAVYFQESLLEISQDAAREMRILSAWIGQRQEQGIVLPVACDGTAKRAADAAYAELQLRGLVPALQHNELRVRARAVRKR